MSFVKMDWGTGLNSDSILPDSPSVDDPASQNDKSHSKMSPRGPNNIENLNDATLRVEIKEEQGELFMGRSIDVENDETFFPSLSQMSTPNSSIIRTNNSEIRYDGYSIIQRTPSGGTRFIPRLLRSRKSIPKDPLEILPPNVINELRRNFVIGAEKIFHKCYLCDLRFATKLELNNHHRLVVHHTVHKLINTNTNKNARKVNLNNEVKKTRLSSDTEETNSGITQTGYLEIPIPSRTNHKIQPPVNKATQDPLEITPRGRTSSDSIPPVQVKVTATPNFPTGSTFKCVEGETREERTRRLNNERSRRSRERRRKRETPEETRGRLAAYAEWKTKRFAKETPEERKKRVAAYNAARRKKYLISGTPEKRAERRTERQKKYLAEKRIAAYAECSGASQNDESHSEMRPPGQSSIENMDDSAFDIEIKEEVGELFMGRSIDVENEETIFPTGLILIHDQPALTTTTSDTQRGTQLLTYTPVYMDEKQSPSYLQMSTPKSSIIRRNHSEIQFVERAIQPTPSEGTRFPATLHASRNLTPKDPLGISPEKARNDLQSNPETNDTIDIENICHKCSLCNKRFATVLGLANHRVGVHHTSDKIVNTNRNVAKVNMRPKLNLTNHGVGVHRTAGVIGNTNIKATKGNVSVLRSNLNPTVDFAPGDALKIAQPTANHEVQTKPATNVSITKHFTCSLCGMNFCTFAERNDHVLRAHEHILCSQFTQKDHNLASCHVNIFIPTNQHIIEVHKKKVHSSNNEELTGMDQEPTDRFVFSPTKLKEIIQAECTPDENQVEPIVIIPYKEKRYKCTLCDFNFVSNSERNAHIIAVHEDPETRSDEFLTSLHPPMNKAPSHPLEITPLGRSSCSSESIRPADNKYSLTPNSVTLSDFKSRRRRLDAEKNRRYRQRIRQTESPEQKRARQATDVERNRKHLANETEEQRKRRLAANAERNRKRLANETPEQRKTRLAANAERQRNSLAQDIRRQKAVRFAADAERQRKYSAVEISEQRRAQLTANAERQRLRLAKETPDERVKRLTADAERHRKRSANETLEQKNARRARQAERMKIYMADGTQEESTARVAGTRGLNFVQCKYCEKSLAPKSLKDHNLRHHARDEDRIFKCDHCEKTFALETHQKTHILTHSKEKHFICDKCGKGYKDKKGLTNHIIFKHRYDEDVQEKYWQE